MRRDTILGYWVTDDPEILHSFIAETKERYDNQLKPALDQLTAVITAVETGWGQDSWQQIATALLSLRQVTNVILSHFSKKATSPERLIPTVFVASATFYQFSLQSFKGKLDTVAAMLTAPSTTAILDMQQQEAPPQLLQRLLEQLRELETIGYGAIEKAMAQLDYDENHQLSISQRTQPAVNPDAAPTSPPQSTTSRLVSRDDDGDHQDAGGAEAEEEGQP